MIELDDEVDINVNVPLRKWIQDEAKEKALEAQKNGSDQIILSKKQTLLRKTTVAYGIVELLRHSRILSKCQNLTTARLCRSKECNVDNFVVHLFSQNQPIGSTEQTQWNNVRGVSMISPALSAQIAEPLFLSTINDEPMQIGMYLEVHITPPLPDNFLNHGIGQTSNSKDCHLFGVLLYELCTGICPFPVESGGNNTLGGISQEKPKKIRATVRYDKKKGKSYSTLQAKPYTPLQELGCPSSLSLLVQNLIDGHDAYPSLDPVSSDIHLLNNDPECFLFDIEDSSGPVQGSSSMQLQIKKGKLYGREKQVSLITDAFCRVSSGKSEAFFIGGYSGSGKTMLVQSLTARVDASGGYVLTQKVDQMSKERPLLDVLSAFDNLCLLIRDQNSPRELQKVTKKIMHDFESDFSVLARLLPKISALFPRRNEKTTKDTSIERVMNLQNVCHTLQRFMRIVSSSLTPVMLFLDDLQWASSTSLKLIEALLSDTRGSSCFFFVGSYRDNEVHDGHPIFDLMSNLDSCGVISTKEHLCGLNQNDLNMMISESVCILPRLCESLSDIIFEKTEGSPYFALEFLRSLVDSRLLKYSLRERRWIWDENKIRSENITDNVLYLLSAKMTSLPENIQLALKVVSCFGIKVDESIVGYLSSTSQYSDFRDWLDQAINEGCIRKHENNYKFVHDKVSEAAYNLIANGNKSQFHYDLGILLYSTSKGQDLGGALFQVVDQINHGIPSLIKPRMKIVIAELNFNAGRKAMDLSDFETASSYLNNALPLLPKNRWRRHYDFSLRLLLLRAKTIYLRGNIEEACDSLMEIIKNGRCIEDKLDAYYLHVTILHACEEREEAYTICCEVLSQLKETIPDYVDMKDLTPMLQETGRMLARMSDADLLGMKETDNSSLRFTLKFYTLLCYISYYCITSNMLPFACCRMVRLTLEHGVCEDSILGLVSYCGFICHATKQASVIREMGRVGKVVMNMLKRFDSSAIMPNVYHIYYGYIAVHTAPVQLCTDNLRVGFKVAVSSGKYAHVAFFNSIHTARNAFLSGQHLSTLLKEIDYYLQVMTQFRNKIPMPYLRAYRETISILIDKGHSTGSQNKTTGHNGNAATPNAVNAERCNETVYFNHILQSFWLGQSERCYHYSKKVLEFQFLGSHNRLMILFYAALNAFRGLNNKNGSGSKFTKAKTLFEEAMSVLRPSLELSPLNFSNKVYLLEAEMLSLEKKHQEATSLYAAAITSACSAGYVHEHGLACELAGHHYKKIGEENIAFDFFQQSKRSYMRWGSQMKVASITRKIEDIQRK